MRGSIIQMVIKLNGDIGARSIKGVMGGKIRKKGMWEEIAKAKDF